MVFNQDIHVTLWLVYNAGSKVSFQTKSEFLVLEPENQHVYQTPYVIVLQSETEPPCLGARDRNEKDFFFCLPLSLSLDGWPKMPLMSHGRTIFHSMVFQAIENRKQQSLEIGNKVTISKGIGGHLDKHESCFMEDEYINSG